MLSPASLRVCCLAVMAPALTKADRRTDCLPVVLSNPFSVSKTIGKVNEFALSKLTSKCELQSRRKTRMVNACFRTPIRTGIVFPLKTRCPVNNVCKPLPYDNADKKVRINAEVGHKSWHGTNVTTAVADKVRWKYTMNKNNNSVKKMGLAKANTAISLQSLKKMNRITQLSDSNKGNSSSILRDGETSPDLINSDLQCALGITEVAEPVLEIATNSVSASEEDAIVPLSSSDDLISLPQNNETRPVETPNSNSSHVPMQNDAIPSELNCNIPALPSSPEVSLSEISVETVNRLACILTESGYTSEGEELRLQQKDTVSLNCITSPSTTCDVPAQSSETCDSTTTSKPETAADTVVLQLSENGSVETPVFELGVPDHSSCTDMNASVLPSNSNLTLPPDLEETEDEMLALLAESFLPSMSKKDTSSVKKLPASAVFSDFLPVDFKSGISMSPSNYSETSVTKFGGNACSKPTVCCPLSEQELSSLKELVAEKERQVNLAIQQSHFVLRKHVCAHAKRQLTQFVEHYQKKLAVPCQRQAPSSSSKPVKDMSDLKAELLQNEDVKNLSTAALVSLVRKLESSGSPGSLLSQQKGYPDSSSFSPSERVTAAAFDPEEYADIRHTSKMLSAKLRNVLKTVDPDLTESSDEECISDSEDSDSPESSLLQKRALRKYLTERAALAKCSTWVISRIHEMENQLRTLNGVMKKVCESEGNIYFEEQVSSQSSALSSAGSSNANLQHTFIKQSEVKNISGPVNGYLDHGPMSSSASHFVQNTDSALLSQIEQQHQKTSTLLDVGESCRRTLPLNRATFRKRKLLPTTGLHLTNSKFARLSTVGCDCNSQNLMQPCVLCTGRYNCVQSVDPGSMTLPDRIALLDSTFHPLLSFEKDISLGLHMESVLKKKEGQYQSINPLSPLANHRRLHFGAKPKRFTDMRSHSRKLNRYARSLLSAKYRNKHVRSTKHLRKHRLVFGKWRKLQTKSSFSARDRIRRISVVSSASSRGDSPVPSPSSIFDDGFGYDQLKKKRDDSQFDITDFIMPYNSKSGRSVQIEYKEIVIPSWRYKDAGDGEQSEMEEKEDISDASFIKRHDKAEVEEKKKLRSSVGMASFFRRARRQHRCDSRADSSGANTPDPVLLCNQDIMFQVPNSNDGPSPVASPPTTPSSATVVSDDSQPSLGNGPLTHFERRKFVQKKPSEESTSCRPVTNDYEDVAPYEPRVYPLSDKEYENLLENSDHFREDIDVAPFGQNYPASPESSTSSTSTVEEEEDITDPEWTVVKRDTGPEQALVLKFAKR